MLNGKAECIYSEENIYTGNFRNGKRNGFGMNTFEKEEMYKGY